MVPRPPHFQQDEETTILDNLEGVYTFIYPFDNLCPHFNPHMLAVHVGGLDFLAGEVSCDGAGFHDGLHDLVTCFVNTGNAMCGLHNLFPPTQLSMVPKTWHWCHILHVQPPLDLLSTALSCTCEDMGSLLAFLPDLRDGLVEGIDQWVPPWHEILYSHGEEPPSQVWSTNSLSSCTIACCFFWPFPSFVAPPWPSSPRTNSNPSFSSVAALPLAGFFYFFDFFGSLFVADVSWPLSLCCLRLFLCVLGVFRHFCLLTGWWAGSSSHSWALLVGHSWMDVRDFGCRDASGWLQVTDTDIYSASSLSNIRIGTELYSITHYYLNK